MYVSTATSTHHPSSACYAETDPSNLLGQFSPNEGGEHGSKVAWFDGPVTRAFITGRWALLDDLGLAEGQVQERLNPLLERPPVWLLAEKGDSAPLQQGAGFQLVATMTPPRR
jgi:midasin (ATPase involved in ribosome maturation)